MQRLIPEFTVSNLAESLAFYFAAGFTVLYDRPEEGFAMLDIEGSQIMLEQRGAPGRRNITLEPASRPFGGGVNFQIQVADVDAVCGNVVEAGYPLHLATEERWYRRESSELGNRQFWVCDPDGYLLRFYQDLGSRSV